jgi:DNA polymerase-3 subunit gamma/tau
MPDQTYLVTARKYRPQVFGELVAQEHVSETLKNAIRLDRLAHAYLFSGPRGVGKTTAARILAKAINCTTPLADRDANAEPCRQCESCLTFEQGRSLNIIEIDAASNNRVDDIRDLRDTVRVPPQGGRRKVYIVDEVHMLTASAFNALLKTLEEPPPHVLFIFATTEPHRVLPTILSRCQRFDFRRIAVPEIVSRLEDICGEEQITADEASLMLIARKGDGALRDALSVFDQAVSLCGSEITYPELAHSLGVVDVDRYFDVTDRITARDSAGMLRLVEQTVRSGHDLQEFLAGLSEHLRNLLVARTMEDGSLIEAVEATRQRYRKTAASFSESDLLRLLTLAAEAEDAVKGSTHPRLKVETVLLKMATLALGADLREVIAKIDRLDRMAREGKLAGLEPSTEDEPGSPAAASAPSSSAGADSDDAPEQSPNASGRRAVARPPQTDPQPQPEADPQAGPAAPAEGAAPNGPASTDGRGPRGSGETQEAATRPKEDALRTEPDLTFPAAGESPAPVASAAGDHPVSTATGVLGTPALSRRRSLRPEVGRAEAERGVKDETESAAAAGAGPITAIWNELLERVRKDKIQVWSLLHHTKPDRYDDGVVYIAVPNDFHRRVLASQSTYVAAHLEPLANVPVRSIRFSIHEGMDSRSEETASEFDPYDYMTRKRRENPVIRAIFEQFGGELAW